MRVQVRSKRIWSILLVVSLIFSLLGIPPVAKADGGSLQVTLVGDLQKKLGADANWDPSSSATQMTALGGGLYQFTGTLPAGTYQYKVVVGGTWDESYGITNYTNPNGFGVDSNIQITLAHESQVSFYYNHNLHLIADSTFYTPLEDDKLPRVIGSFQSGIGDVKNWSAADSSLVMQDLNFDHIYSVTQVVYAGDHEFQVVLGKDEHGEIYPATRKPLQLQHTTNVTFKYNAITHEVFAEYSDQTNQEGNVPIPENTIRIHYSREDGNYSDYGLWLWDDVESASTNWPTGVTMFPAENRDSYGAFVDIKLKSNAQKIGFLVMDPSKGDAGKDGGDKVLQIISPKLNEVWIKQGSDTVYLYEPVELPEDTIRIHYSREDGNYSDYGLWLWDDVESASTNWPTGATMFPAENRDSYGAFVDIKLKSNARKIGFLVLDPSKGDAGKDGGDKSFALLDRYKHLFIQQGDNTVYISPYGEIPTGLVSAEVISSGKLLLGLTTTDGLDTNAMKQELQIKTKDGISVVVDNVKITGTTTVEVSAQFTLEDNPLTVMYSGRTVTAATGWRMIDELYYYDGDDLGATYQSDGSAILKLWAPLAEKVTVQIYDKDDATQAVGSPIELVKEEKGVWSVTLVPHHVGAQDLKGYYYQYEVTHQGESKKVLDPYAKSMAEFRVNTKGEPGPDGDTVGKAAIVDLNGTDPVGYGFADIPGYEQREDAIIWEIHIRDFTSDESIEADLHTATWGTFDAFKKKLDYIKSLGVTHVQLLPVMAWYYGDEAKMKDRENTYSAQDNEYNWGYDPHNYFSPDGAYSEDPTDPHLRIKELKEMIHAIHEADMGVILDVVYTHMAKADFLNDIVPNYYFFQDANGNFIGGFGNNLATNHKMAEKLMIDSVKYWFEEYKIDGMRFDMMGDATYDSIQNAYDAAAAINPKALFLGEGWRTFGGAASDPSLAGKGADQDWMDKTDDVGVFSDEFRNELKSGFGHEGEPRFITGGARDIQTIFNNIKAQPSNVAEDDPGDIVQYIEAHDNLTLHDVIAIAIKKDPADPANAAEIMKRIRLGNVLTLTSQGTVFLHAGQEYGRTKEWKASGIPEQKYTVLKDSHGHELGYFIHDSYDSSDAINKFEWQKTTDAVQFPENVKTREYTTGLIELRKSTDAFRLGDQALVNTNVTLMNIPEIGTQDLVIAYKNKATDGTGLYYVFVNADDKQRVLSLSEDLTSGLVVVDDDEAGIIGVTSKSGFTLTSNSITLDPLTAVIIKMDAPAAILSGLSVDQDSYSLQIGSTHQTVVYANYDDGSKRTVTKQAVYTSSDPEVATVSTNGLVTGLAEGTAVITVSYGNVQTEVTVNVTAEPVDNKRYVQFNYIRPDGDYTDWNLWVWNTGVKNDQIDFEKIENGMATVMIEVAPETTNVGFVLRKGTDWNTAKQDIPDDRLIPLVSGETFTKVYVTSMVREINILSSISGPILADGNITFLYRDDQLFKDGAMDSISEVQVIINGEAKPMTYDPKKEWFSYTLHSPESGTYEYMFAVTRDGTTNVITDPKNTVNGKSVVTYFIPKVTVSAEVNPGTITSEENAVLQLKVSTEDEVYFQDGYVDLTQLGGPSKVKLDTELLEQTIAVKDTVSPGTKTIPVTLIDQYGNRHTGTANVNVKARIQTDASDFDWDEARIYFVLTDRFMDGDPTNNINVDKNHPEAYHGGDFRGLIDKLDYIQQLGVNTLWITPIVDNIDFNKGMDFGGTQYGYHGYWAKDFTQIDEHLGDLETFKELIDKAHDRGIKIMVDVVLNHTGYGLKPDDNAPRITQEDKDRFKGMLRTDGVSADTDMIKGELAGLPDFITEDPAVRNQIIEWQTDWLERARTSRGDTIDYFRVDTVKHVEDTTWKAFKNALTAIDPKFKLIGEYYGASVFSDGGQLQSGQMDSLLDFGFKHEAKKFVDGDVESAEAYLAEREAMLDNTRMMGQFLSSHDEDGFLSHYVNWDKGKLMAAAAMQITAKGQPVIYYGEELGRSGKTAGDMSKGEYSENRDDMPWDQIKAEQKLLTHYQKLLNIRAEYSKVFSKGKWTSLAASNAEGYLAFDKVYNGEHIVTAIHVKEEPKQVTLAVPFAAGSKVKDLYSGTEYQVSSDRKVTVTLPAMDDGGTVILAAVPVSGGGSSGTTTGGSGSSYTVVTSPQVPVVNSGQQVVSEQELKDGKEKVRIELKAGTREVILPLKAGEVLGTRSLELKADGLLLVIPSETLQALKQSLPADQLQEASILLKLQELSESETMALMAQVTDAAKLKLGSYMFDLGLFVVNGDGSLHKLEEPFTTPISLTMDLHPTIDQALAGMYRIADNGGLEYVGGKLINGKLVASVAQNGNYGILEYNKSFTDLSGHWAEKAIKQLVAKHIIKGTSEYEFSPSLELTRAQYAAMLVRALNLTVQEGTIFEDVDNTAWYASIVSTAYHYGLIKGKSDTIFAPDAPITREEMAMMLVRAYKISGRGIANGQSVQFIDQGQISDWAKDAFSEAVVIGLLKGQGDGKFAPKSVTTRAEGAQAMLNLLHQLGKN